MGTIVLLVRVVSSIPRIPLATLMTRVANRSRGCLTLLFLGSAALFGLLASRSTRAFVGTSQPAGRRTCKTGLRTIGLFFATQTGNTETVAVFGCGDSASYGDNFCDGIEELHETFKAAGAKMVGYVDSSGYSHTESKSEADGKFLGLPTDQDNEDDQSEERVEKWISQLKGEGMPI